MLNVYTANPPVIIPAAGLSTRMSTWKLGLPYHGQTLLSKAITLAYEVSDRVIVVVGHRADLARRETTRFPKTVVLYNPWYPLGLFSSLLVAIRVVRRYAAFVLLPDLPLLEGRHFAMLPRGGSSDVCRPSYQGRPGHPVFLSRRVLARAGSFPLSSEMPQVLSHYRLTLVPATDPAVILDVDSPLDYRELVKQTTPV